MNSTEASKKDQELSQIQHIFVGVAIVVISILSIITNLILCSKIKRRSICNPTEKINKLFINLVFINLGITFLAFPLSGTASLFQNWIWKDFGCQYYGSIAIFFGMQMMMTAFMICADLYYEANLNTYVDEKKEQTRVLMVVTCWFNSIFWMVVPFLGWSSYGFEETGFSCTVVHKKNEYVGYTTYIIASAITCYILPIIAMILFFQSNVSAEMNEKQKDLARFNKKKIFIMMIFFLIEWAPYTIYYIWPIFDENVPHIVNAIGPVAAKCATFITPLIVMGIVDYYLRPKTR